MKKVRIGFSLLLMGIIFSAPGDTYFWWIGFIVGIIGFIIIALSKEK